MPERNRNFTQTIVGICQDAKHIVQYSKESVERAREAMRENEEAIRVGVSPMTPPQVFMALWPQIQKICMGRTC